MTESSTVHLVQQSPFASQALASCLRVCTSEDVIVLMHDAVYAATTTHNWPTAKIYALGDDLATRGISAKRLDVVRAIDYAEFVELCVSCRHSQSWF